MSCSVCSCGVLSQPILMHLISIDPFLGLLVCALSCPIFKGVQIYAWCVYVGRWNRGNEMLPPGCTWVSTRSLQILSHLSEKKTLPKTPSTTWKCMHRRRMQREGWHEDYNDWKIKRCIERSIFTAKYTMDMSQKRTRPIQILIATHSLIVTTFSMLVPFHVNWHILYGFKFHPQVVSNFVLVILLYLFIGYILILIKKKKL